MSPMDAPISLARLEESLWEARRRPLHLPKASVWGLLTQFPRELANGEVPHFFQADPYMTLLARAWLATRLTDAPDYAQLRQLMEGWMRPLISYLEELPTTIKPTEADLIAILAKTLFTQGYDHVAYAFLLLRAQEHPSGTFTSQQAPMVRRRTGQIVPWLPHKIEKALEKAFQAVGRLSLIHI